MTDAFSALEFISQNAPSWIDSLYEVENRIKAHVSRASLLQKLPKRAKESGSNESIRPRSRGGDQEDCKDGAPLSPPSPTLHGPFAREASTSVPSRRKRASGAESCSAISASNPLLVIDKMAASISTERGSRSKVYYTVYYDSEIQKILEQIVNRIGSARHNIRKARLVMAENILDDNLRNSTSSPLSMFRLTTRTKLSRATADAVQSPTRLPRLGATATESVRDIFSEADEGLEKAQSLCERGAHRILQEGDCEAEIAGARINFEQAKRVADRELTQLKAEDEERRKKQEEKQHQRQFDDISINKGGNIGPQKLEADDSDGNEDVEAICHRWMERARELKPDDLDGWSLEA